MTVNRSIALKVYNWSINNLSGWFQRCPLCREPLRHPEQQHPPHHICPACLQRLQPLSGPLCHCCLPCAEEDAGYHCGRCLKNPPAFADCRSAWQYTFPLNRLINRYKHHGDLSIEPLLFDIWLAALTPPPENVDALVPIPLHWWRQTRRGFNQATRLASLLSPALDLPLLSALDQPRQAKLLQGQTAATRRRQVRGRFHVREDVSNLHLILIDDVMTTGSTANEAARVLLDAGARRVDVWTLCRVLPASS
jgi:ComF family protein